MPEVRAMVGLYLERATFAEIDLLAAARLIRDWPSRVGAGRFKPRIVIVTRTRKATR